MGTTNRILFNPCVDWCYQRYGKQYTASCDETCEYARVVKEKKNLEEQLKKFEDDWK